MPPEEPAHFQMARTSETSLITWCMVRASTRGSMAKSTLLCLSIYFDPSKLILFLWVWLLLGLLVLFCMTRYTARVPIRGPTATSISLSLNGATLSYILLTKYLFFHWSYVGSVVDGKFHGEGIYTWANGSKYSTFFWQHLFFKHISYRLASLRYVGAFILDKEHGHGTKTWPEGQKYGSRFIHQLWTASI